MLKFVSLIILAAISCCAAQLTTTVIVQDYSWSRILPPPSVFVVDKDNTNFIEVFLVSDDQNVAQYKVNVAYVTADGSWDIAWASFGSSKGGVSISTDSKPRSIEYLLVTALDSEGKTINRYRVTKEQFAKSPVATVQEEK